MPNLQGKVALITGSSSGIGAGIAIHFAELGASVVINGRNVTKLQKVAEQCKAKAKNPKNILVVAGDVSDETAAQDVVNKTVSHFGKLDILVNNAGILRVEQTMAVYDEIMKTNVRAPFHLTQLAVPHLKATEGNIINISSVAGIKTINAENSSFAYPVSKAALDHFTRHMALDLAKHKVRVNSINPAVIDTDILSTIGVNDEMKKVMLDNCYKIHPLGRPGYPEDVAKAAAFLASDDASFITGILLPVDGGYCINSPKFE